jgi:predicted MFS family arabinose efflux permease
MSDQPGYELEPTSTPGTLSLIEESPPPAAPAPPKRLPPVWRNRDYMLLWSGQVVSTLGSGISGIVFPLLILALTNSPQAAGIAGALASLPYLIFSLPVGALIDRWDRKRVMMLCDAGRALSLASIPVAMAFGVLTVWQLYANAFIEGTLFVFFNIAEVAALSRVVVKEQLPDAAAQNEASFALAGIVAPSVGTVLYKVVGQMVPFVFDAVSYTISVFSLALIRTPFQGERAAVGTERHLLQEIREGLAWLWNQPLIRYIAVLTGGLNFSSAGSFLIIIVLAQAKGADEALIGTIFSIGSIGGIAGALLGGRIQRRFRFGQVIIGTVWIQALLFPLYAVAPDVLLLGVISAFIFVTGPIYNVVQFSYRISIIPDALQGRVNSTFRLVAFGFQPLGAALSGVLIEQLGVYWALGLFAAVQIGLAVMTTLSGQVRNARPIAGTTG